MATSIGSPKSISIQQSNSPQRAALKTPDINSKFQIGSKTLKVGPINPE